MWKKSVLSILIEEAVKACYECGEGRCEDDLWETGLRVTAEWVECGDPECSCVMHISVYRDDVPLLAYDDPETKTN